MCHVISATYISDILSHPPDRSTWTKVGFQSKGTLFILQSGAYAYLYLGILYGLWGDLEEGGILTMLLFHHLKWGLIFDHNLVGPPIMAQWI